MLCLILETLLLLLLLKVVASTKFLYQLNFLALHFFILIFAQPSTRLVLFLIFLYMYHLFAWCFNVFLKFVHVWCSLVKCRNCRFKLFALLVFFSNCILLKSFRNLLLFLGYLIKWYATISKIYKIFGILT